MSESEPSFPVKQGQGIFLDGMSFGGTGFSSLINEEFLINFVRLSLKKVFSTEFENFMGRFSSSGLAQHTMTKKSTGRAKIRA